MNPEARPTIFTELFNNNPDSRVYNLFLESRECDFPITELARITGLNRQRLKARITSLLKLIIKMRKLFCGECFKRGGGDQGGNCEVRRL
jgi:hypothetical protein